MASAALEALGRRWRRLIQPAQMQVLVHLPGQPPRVVPLHGGAYQIGRDSDCQIKIDHSAVSRHHALLEQRGPNWLLTDQASTNGLWWQGRRIRQLLLSDGDNVRFGPSQQAGLPELDFQIRPIPKLHKLVRSASLGLATVAASGLLVLGISVTQSPIRGSLASVRGPLVLYDQAGKPITSVDALRHHEPNGLRHYPTVLIDALLASEDSRFWWHPGVDPVGTARALLTNLVGGRVLEGGSTLTQQLARTLYPDQVGQGETLERKWRELLVALQIEARFSKRDVLLSYLNRVYLGVGCGSRRGGWRRTMSVWTFSLSRYGRGWTGGRHGTRKSRSLSRCQGYRSSIRPCSKATSCGFGLQTSLATSSDCASPTWRSVQCSCSSRPSRANRSRMRARSSSPP